MNKNECAEILSLIKKRYDNGKDNFLCNCCMDYMNNYISIETMFEYEISYFAENAAEYDLLKVQLKKLITFVNMACNYSNNKSYIQVTESILKIAL